MHKYGRYYLIIESNSLLFIRFLKHFNAIILLCLFEIIGGTLLFFNRKAGWMIAMIALLTDLLLPAVRMLLKKTRLTDFFEKDDQIILVIVCWFILFSSLLVIMCLKPFRFTDNENIFSYCRSFSFLINCLRISYMKT
jgi:hypothetical protein